MTEPEYNLRVISLGAGVQSSAMYWLAEIGEIKPKPDYAIFADTQQEPPWVYENLKYMQERGTIPIRVGTAGDIGESIRRSVDPEGERFAAIPFWINKEGRAVPGRRQCTSEFKIRVITREIRSLLGLRPHAWASSKYKVEQWVGISLDEVHRAKRSREKWIDTRWPLILDTPMRRSDCIEWMELQGHPIPRKSACIMCPFRTPEEYSQWRDTDPEIFAKAVEFDRLLRSNGTVRGMEKEQFVSNLLLPLEDTPPPDDTDGVEVDHFGNECEGLCGV